MQVLTVMQEAFFTRLVPVFREVTLPALQKFQPEAYPLHAVLAGAAALAASALLYALGVWLRRWPERVSSEEQQTRIEAMRGVARQWLPYLLVLAPTPFGGILIIAAGFFRIAPVVVVLAVSVAEMLWRVSPLL